GYRSFDAAEHPLRRGRRAVDRLDARDRTGDVGRQAAQHHGDLVVHALVAEFAQRHRHRRDRLIKLIWHDGVRLCMLTKRLEHGQFAWPTTQTIGRIALSSAQLAALLDGCEWRARRSLIPSERHQDRRQLAQTFNAHLRRSKRHARAVALVEHPGRQLAAEIRPVTGVDADQVLTSPERRYLQGPPAGLRAAMWRSRSALMSVFKG